VHEVRGDGELEKLADDVRSGGREAKVSFPGFALAYYASSRSLRVS